jgi:MFS family permease
MSANINRRYLLTLLLAILAFNYVDRQTLGLVLQDIKADLGLTDTQLGFLNGIAFALFYALMGVPIARWADRGNRAAIISIAVALWSVAVALCGLAVNFLQLLVIRVGAGVGEAGCVPPALSLIGDYFTRSERPRAVAFYYLGTPLSVLIGYFLAGWLNEFYGWRVTFMLLGLPGLGLAGLAWLTVREPRRETPQPADSGWFVGKSGHQPEDGALREVCVALWANATFRHLLLSLAVCSFFGYGLALWQPTYLIRSYGLATGELGTWFAVIYGVGGLVGTYSGGELASRYAPDNERLQLRVMAMVYASFALVSPFIYLSPNYFLAFGLMGLAAIVGSTVNGPLFAIIQSLVPQRMRATSIALVYLFVNLIGMGLGPLAAGALSDALRWRVGQDSLRYALLALCPGYLWAAWHLRRASNTVERDLNSVGPIGIAPLHG